MKLKTIAWLIMLTTLVSLLVGCDKAIKTNTEQKAQIKNEKREIRIAYQASSKLVLLAKAKGLYEEEFGKDGTEVKYSLFLSGPPMIEAFAGDRMDVGTTGDMPPVSARAAGIDLKIIGNAGRDIGGSKLLVRSDSPIKSVQDLKGKKVATQVGSGAHHFLILLLQKDGLNISDVNLVNLPATDYQNVLDNGNVTAVVTWEPWGSSIENSKVGKVLLDSTDIKRSPSVFLARNAFGTKNPDLVERFLKVNQKAAEYIKQNPDEALEIISKESKLPVAVLSKSYKNTDWNPRITDSDIQNFMQVKDFLKETNVLKKDFDIKELFDLHYLKNTGIE